MGDVLQTSDDVLDILLLQVGDGRLGIRDTSLSILDAVDDVIKALSLKGTLDEALGELEHVLGVLDWGLGGGGAHKSSGNEKRGSHK